MQRAQNQRVHYKYYMTGDTKHIKKHRIDALHKIGFIWNTSNYYWNVNYTNLHSTILSMDIIIYQNGYVTNLLQMMQKKRCCEQQGVIYHQRNWMRNDMMIKFYTLYMGYY